MEQFKVVMLPTEKATIGTIMKCLQLSPLHCDEIDKQVGELTLNKNSMVHSSNDFWQSQHLYIVELHSAINSGDWYTKDNDLISSKENLCIYTGNEYKVVASTDSSLNLPIIPEPFVKAYIEDNDLTIHGFFSKNNTAIISWATSEQQEVNKRIIKAESHDGLVAKAWWQSLSVAAQTYFTTFYLDTESITVSEAQILKIFLSENVRKASYEDNFSDSDDNNLPKTVEEFITKFNNYCPGWEFIGKDPFTEANRRNKRLQFALSKLAEDLFGDDDLVELEDLFNDCLDNTISDNQSENQVDFDLLKVTISKLNLCEIDSEEPMFSLEEDKNLKLFFKSMKKSSFAHLAHKKLSQ